MGLANYLSSKSRLANQVQDEVFQKDSEWLLHFCQSYVQDHTIDYMIFGHRHLPLDIALDRDARYINLGEWLYHSTYAVFDGNNLTLKRFESDDPIPAH